MRLRDLQPCWILQGSNNSLHLQVVMKAVDSLLSAYSTHLVSTKRNCSIKDVEAVNPDCPSPQRPCQVVCSVNVPGENTGSQTIACRVCPSYYFIKVPGTMCEIIRHVKAQLLQNSRTRCSVRVRFLTHLNFKIDCTGPKISSFAINMSS